jgi:hypothetical protein
MATASTPSSAPRSLLGLVAGATVVAALAAFLAGRLSADAAPSPSRDGRGARGEVASLDAPSPASEPARRAQAQAGAARQAWPAEAAQAAPALAPPAMAGLTPPGQSAPEVVAAQSKAAKETLMQLESIKGELVQRCWPAGGLPKGRTSARVTFSVAYDAAGREVMRGVSDDRRAPSGELTRCLQRQPLGTLRVTPTGTALSLNVAMNLP